MSNHNFFMEKAIAEAEKGRGSVSPNPLVGALVVKNNKVISKGHHSAYGKSHAEVEALKSINPRLKADLYVTLEPCAHYGKTPPCLNLIMKFKNFENIIIGCKDPNPQVKGKSIRGLRKAGFQVKTGMLSTRIKKQNEAYFYNLAKKRPFVTLKAAITLDGKIATRDGDSKWITSSTSRKKAHRLRAENDGIMVGIGTVVADDPLLIPRNTKGRRFKPPARIIIDPKLKIPLDSKIIKTAKAYPTIIACSNLVGKSKKENLEKLSVKIISIKEKNRDGHFSMDELMKELARRNIASLLIEGGSKLNSEVWQSKLVNKIIFFVAPKLFGGQELPVIGGQGISSIAGATDLKINKVEQLDKDIYIEAYVK